VSAEAALLNQKVLSPDVCAPAAVSTARAIAPLCSSGGPFPRNSEATGATIHTGRPSKAGKSGRPLQAHVTPEKILQAFNTGALKREKPDDHRLLLGVIADAVRLSRPLPFVLYWGKGPRAGLAEPDIACLDYLTSLARRVRDVYAPGVAFKLIFTDTHARLNGHSDNAIYDYFGLIDAAARLRGFDCCWLGELVDAALSAGTVDDIDDALSEDTLQRLRICAAKWFRGEGTAEEAAEKYFQMNMVEKRAVQQAFPAAIFVTFNGSEFRSLFPDRMPIFYMYSLKRGVGVKPWFLPAAPVVPSTVNAEPS
jgi:L-tyrosine isonitrile synthase